MAWEKIISLKDGLKPFIVVEDGKVSFEKSEAKFRENLLLHIAKQEGEETLIKECMTSLFDQHRGTALNVAAITSMTVQKMAIQVPNLGNPTLFSFLSKRIGEVLKELTGDDESKPYAMRKGPAGGHYRKSDVAPVAAK
jgi:hypothetical protein